MSAAGQRAARPAPVRRALPARRATLAVLTAALTLLPASALAVYGELQPDTARTVAPGRVEVGVFAPLRVGVTEQVELSLHPLLALVAPHLDATVAWGEPLGLEVASRHGLLYPTPLMRLLSREGTGGLVPHDVTYPQLLATSHHLLVSRGVGQHLLTLRAGGRLAWNLTAFDGPRFWSEVEWHFVRPRTAAWFAGWSADAGLAAEGPLWGAIGYRADLAYFLMPGLDGQQAAEWSVLATFRPRPGLLVRAGAIWSWCQFPYGERTSVALPLADVIWAFDAPWC